MDYKRLSKDITFAEFLEKLDVPKFGKKGSERVADKIKNVRTLRHLIESGTVEEALLLVDGVGEVIKNNLLEKLLDIDLLLALEEMEDEGFEMFKDQTVHDIIQKAEEEEIQKEEIIKSILERPEETEGIKNLNFVITGTLSIPRADFEEIIYSHGGRVQSSVNTKTNYLIMAPDGHGTTKHRKALALGTKIITEREFRDMI